MLNKSIEEDKVNSLSNEEILAVLKENTEALKHLEEANNRLMSMYNKMRSKIFDIRVYSILMLFALIGLGIAYSDIVKIITGK